MKRAAFGTTVVALAALVGATVAYFPKPGVALAAPKAGEIARTISTDVFELLVGGSWEQKKQSGYYRAIALAAGKTGKEYAEVWLQWIEVGKKSAKVFKNVPLKEITALNLPSLTLAMDVEESGNAILIVTHYDEQTSEPITYEFRASQPGIYEALETQVAAEETSEPETQKDAAAPKQAPAPAKAPAPTKAPAKATE